MMGKPQENTAADKTASSEEKKKVLPPSEILKMSANRALQGGVAGASAMAIQVCTLMWLRTTMNYQYRHGLKTTQAMRKLYKEGGVPRFYRGLAPALFQGPLSRLGDTGANMGVLMLLDNLEQTRDLPVSVKTACASFTAALWRIVIMPIDALKTTAQVEGVGGWTKLFKKAGAHGPQVFWHGALGAYSATLVGHYPWFYTYNQLNEWLPKPNPEKPIQKLARNAFMGFTSSVVSDTTSNSIRVIKTVKQTYTDRSISYPEAVRLVVEKDGVIGLLGRGLKTRIITNGCQGLMFSVLWRYFDDFLVKRSKRND